MRVDGHILEGTREVADTLRCPHCGCHFIVRRGSGVERGFCLKCCGVTCGKPGCMARCFPMEAQLEAMERV